MQRIVQFGGTTCASMAFLMAVACSFPGCGSSKQPEVAEIKKFRPADEAGAQPVPDDITNGPASLKQSDATQPAPADAVAFATPPADPTATSAPATSANREASPPGPQMSELNPQLKSILDQMNRLGSQQPKGTTQQEQLDEFIRLHTQRLQLAKQALALNPPAEVKRQVVMAMYEVLQRFVDFRVPSAMAQLNDFAKVMAADPDAEVARIGRHAQFSSSLSRIVTQQNTANGVNGSEVVTEAKKLLDAEKGKVSEDTLQLVGQTADMLTEGGFKADAAGLIEAIAEALAGDAKLADQAPRYALVAKVVRMDLDQLLNNVIREEAGADEKIEAAVQTLLTDIPPSRDLLNRVQTIAHILESTAHYKSALTMYDLVAAKFATASDAELAEDAAKFAPGAKLRIGLVGQPLTVEGVSVDGAPFDWSAYSGKIVLVDFWATWCGPCLEEIPNIRNNFEQFHSKGFEVVGVNLDTRSSDLKQFLTLQGQSIPWATVTSQVVLDGKADERDWTKLPMAAKCGVQSIPFVVLVGRDGKVDSIHVRGPKLKKRLSELLGEPVTGEIPADPTQPAGAVPADPSAAKPTNGKQSRAVPSGAATPLGLFLAQTLLATALAELSPAEDSAINPYVAKPGLTPAELVAYIQKMLDRPQAIQTREGFAAGIIDACDRVLAAQSIATDAEQLVAIQSKLALLHRDACDGRTVADEQLMAFVEQLRDNSRPEVAQEVAFFRLERRVLTAKEAPLDQVGSVLDAVKEFSAKQKLGAKHLRMASGTVALINRLESGDERETRFAELGDLFAKSADKDLARYGRKIAKAPAVK
jgi:thiol-disulfide isomerase/thioredoxin